MKTLCDLVSLDVPRAERVRQHSISPQAAQELAQLTQALADPIRLQILSALSIEPELCGCDLAWITRRAQNLIAHHLKSLKNAELLESRREGKMVFYSLTDTGKTWLKVLQSKTRVVA